jgi:GT2 family glycosyltransferase
MSVACVIVNYNGSADTIRAITSLEPQLEQQDFIVIVDNGSEVDDADKLRTVASERILIVQTGRNLGFAGGCNAGIRRALQARCNYVFILNNDIWAEDCALQRLVQTLEHDPDLAAACPLIVRMDDISRVWAAGGYINLRRGRFGHRFEGASRSAASASCTVNFAPGCALMVRSQALLTVGMLPERWFLYFEDAEFGLKLAQSGLSIRYVPDAVIRHAIAASVRRTDINYFFYWRNYLLFIHEWMRGSARLGAMARVLGTMATIAAFNIVIAKPGRARMIATAAAHGLRREWGPTQ